MAPGLSGKVVIVDVEGRHGPAVARRLAAEGATVVLCGDDAERAGAVLAALEPRAPGRAAFYLLGSGSADELDGLAAFVDEIFGSGRGSPQDGS
jgi:NAD(P)-dependent dehydrogenase (short-subunit alcohol dehydrogenase family)